MGPGFYIRKKGDVNQNQQNFNDEYRSQSQIGTRSLQNKALFIRNDVRVDPSRSISMLEGSRDSATLLREKRNKMANKLEVLKQQVHIRKIQQIEKNGQKYHDENSQFGKRQENILLNALQFINDVSNGKTDDDTVPPEDRGVDQGFDCKLVAE